MATQLQIFDGTVPIIDFIAQRHFGLGRESLSVAASKVQKQEQSDIRKYKHYWHHEVRDGRRFIYKSKDKQRTLGTMTAHTSNSSLNTENVGDIISVYMPEEDSPSALTATIGGAHKGFRPVKYREGLNVGNLGYVKPRGSITRSILHKLNTGELDSDHPYRNKTAFPNANYKRRSFADNAIANAEAAIVEALYKRYIKVMPKLVNNANIKVRKVI